MFDFAAWQRSRELTESECADILTWTDEPELLAMPGEAPPTFAPLDIAAARMASQRIGLRLAWQSRAVCAYASPDSAFVDSFKYWRAAARRDNARSLYPAGLWKDDAGHWRRSAMPAAVALQRAYGDAFTGQKRYPSPVATGYGKPAQPWNTPAAERVRFIESPDEIGARDVGTYDEIARKADRRADHTGWYCDPFQHETYAGHVLQLPGRNGRPRFLAAYRESANGGLVVELDVIEGEPGDHWNDSPAEQGAYEAAARGDHMAERAAEKERYYQAAWAAGSRWNDLLEGIQSDRRAFLALIRDAKAKCGALGKDSPVFMAVKGTLQRFLREIREARQEQETLAASAAESLYFYRHDAELVGAFNEGAGRAVLS